MSQNENPIQYTSRTYNTVMADIQSNNDFKDKPLWWAKLLAGVMDVFSVMLNCFVNNLYLRTAFTRTAVRDLCQLIDYTLSAQTTSTGYILFDVSTITGTGIYPFTVTTNNLKVKSDGNLEVNSLTYESRLASIFTLVSNTFTTAYVTNNNLTISTDLIYSGYKVRLTSTNTLPNPLQINTDYYVIYKNATTISLATSRINAYAGIEITLLSNGTGTHSIHLFSKLITTYQQNTIPSTITIGTSDGITAFQKFTLPDKFVLKDTLTVTINSVNWTQVDTFVDSISSDTHYKINPLTNNEFEIEFGNGTYGAIPEAFDIFVIYSYGGGVNSNISIKNYIKTYIGSDSNITGCSNPAYFTGGANEESISHAKNLAPILLKTRDRFITIEDGKALVLKYGGVSTAAIIANVYGVNSCKVIGIATGGGNPSPTLQGLIQQYLIDRSVLGQIDARFVDGTITSINVTCGINVKIGYVYANISPYVSIGFKLFLTETGNEIIDYYEENGIELTTTLINTYFSTSFTNLDYTALQKLLDNLTPREFGDTIQSSMAYSYIQSNIDGINYLDITTFGSGFPVSLANDEITTNGTITLSAI